MPMFPTTTPVRNTFGDVLVGLGIVTLFVVGVMSGPAHARSVAAPITYTDAGPAIVLPYSTLPRTGDAGSRTIKPIHSAAATPLGFAPPHPAHPGAIQNNSIEKTGVISLDPAPRSTVLHSLSLSNRQSIILLLALMFATITIVIQRSTRHLRTILIASGNVRRRGYKQR